MDCAPCLIKTFAQVAKGVSACCNRAEEFPFPPKPAQNIIQCFETTQAHEVASMLQAIRAETDNVGIIAGQGCPNLSRKDFVWASVSCQDVDVEGLPHHGGRF